MAEALTPANDGEVLDAITQAVAGKASLEVIGTGAKRAFGRPIEVPRTLDLSGLAGITAYEPSELYLTCRAGTIMAEVEAALAEAEQTLRKEFSPRGSGRCGETRRWGSSAWLRPPVGAKRVPRTEARCSRLGPGQRILMTRPGPSTIAMT